MAGHKRKPNMTENVTQHVTRSKVTSLTHRSEPQQALSWPRTRSQNQDRPFFLIFCEDRCPVLGWLSLLHIAALCPAGALCAVHGGRAVWLCGMLCGLLWRADPLEMSEQNASVVRGPVYSQLWWWRLHSFLISINSSTPYWCSLPMMLPFRVPGGRGWPRGDAV